MRGERAVAVAGRSRRLLARGSYIIVAMDKPLRILIVLLLIEGEILAL